MTKVKITNSNVLFMIVVLMLTVVPQVILGILYNIFNIDLIEYAKHGDEGKAILLAINQYGLILLPVVIFVIFNRLNIKEVFRLNLINIPTLILTVIIAGAAWFLGQFFTIIFYHIYSMVIGQPSNDIAGVLPQNAALGIFLIAISPAICEEALFRGILLKAYENRGSFRAIIISAVLFAITHISVFRFPGPLIIGILAGYLVIKSNSIIPAIIAHFVFNGISMVIYYSTKNIPENVERFPTIPEYMALLFFTVLCIGVLAICIMSFNYVNSNKKKIAYGSRLKEFLYMIFWNAPKVPGIFKKPIGTIYQDIASIITHRPIITVFVIIILLNIMEAMSIMFE